MGDDSTRIDQFKIEMEWECAHKIIYIVNLGNNLWLKIITKIHQKLCFSYRTISSY